MKKMKKLIALFLAASMMTATVGALEARPEKAKTEYAWSELPQNIKTLLPSHRCGWLSQPRTTTAAPLPCQIFSAISLAFHT